MRILGLVSYFVFSLLIAHSLSAAPMVLRMGDADLNGAVQMTDASDALGALLGGGCALPNVGVSADDRLSVADLLLTAQYANGLRSAAELAGDGLDPFSPLVNAGDGQTVGAGSSTPLPLTTASMLRSLTGLCIDPTLLTQRIAIISDTTGGALLDDGATTATAFDNISFNAAGVSDPVDVITGTQDGVIEIAATLSYALADGSGQIDKTVLFTLTVPPICGNGYLETGEACDDGNTTPGDGCDAACQPECTPIVCPNNWVEQTINSEDQFDGGVSLGGWQQIVSPILNGGQAYRGSGSAQIFEGTFNVQSASPTTFDLWILGVRPAAGDWSYVVRVDGNPVGVYDGSAVGATVLDWQMVASISLAAGPHTLAVNPVSTGIAYFDGVALTTDGALNPPSTFLPVASFDLNDPSLDYAQFGGGGSCCGDCVLDAGETCDQGGDNNLGEGFCAGDCSSIQACGDGTTNGTETCDDGDLDDCTPTCNASCSGPGIVPVCGDGATECGEVCDDGDTDDCTSACDATCSGPGIVPVCGDGTVECGEVCDDGDTDDCTPACDATCSGPGIVPVCGDGTAECAEVCDDGDVDPCTAACNATCSGPAANVCGDSITECGETCDDGNTTPGDGCDAGCQLECTPIACPNNWTEQTINREDQFDGGVSLGGWQPIVSPILNGGQAYRGSGSAQILEGTFNVQSASPTTFDLWILGVRPAAGDWSYIVSVDGNPVGVYDGSAVGATVLDWQMVGSLSLSIGPHTLAVNPVSTGIAYFDGVALTTDGALNPPSTFLPVASFDLNDPALDYAQFGGGGSCCGDCVLDPGETCDQGGDNNLGEGFCAGDCSSIQACGDGTTNGTETCDDGAANGSGDGFCLSDCSGVQTCGDGTIEGTEACDDSDADDCTPACNASCTGPGIVPVCGDGTAECGEACDDGDTDDCTAACDATCTGPGIVPVCGDGATQCGEACDDGDANDCTPACNASCSGPGIVPVCGDGTAQCAEACDDGDTDDCTAACDATCSGPGIVPVCGDGAAQCGEACDDGDATLCGGPCNETCTGIYTFVCGDGSLECGEECDDGNLDPSDGCSDTCLISSSRLLAFQVDDADPSSGDGDGQADPGETLLLPVDILNDGSTPLTNVSVQIQSLSTLLASATNPTTLVGAISLGGNAGSQSPHLSVTLDSALACGSNVTVNLLIVSDQGSWTDAFILPIPAAGCQAFGPPTADFNFSVDCSTQVATLTDASLGTVTGWEWDIDNDGTPEYFTPNVTHPFGGVGNYPVTLTVANASGSDSVQLLVDVIDCCGNGTLDAGETCDDGNTASCDGCASDCSHVDDVCGDGISECGEVCDDGYLDDCGSCNQNCTGTGSGSVCGDSMVCPQYEYCDQGAQNGTGDGFCLSDCSAVQICGDGVVNGTEPCDDPDFSPCGGPCNETCTALYVNACGNGVVECGESCDDGNTASCDGCAADCSYVDNLCGDGLTECGEACDDGDLNNCTLACDATCSGPFVNVCGDGERCEAETCDDGNVIPGDGCDATCQLEIGCGFIPSLNAFTDISSTGTQLPLNGDDAGVNVNLGFPFSFFGNAYTFVAASTNGYLTFGSDWTDWTNDPIPSTTQPNDLIAPFWDDLYVDNFAGQGVYVQTDGTAGSQRTVIQWDQVEPLGAGGISLTFQVVFYEGTDILEFHYGPLMNPGSGATVGIESNFGGFGVQYSYNSAVLSNGLSLAIYPDGCLNNVCGNGAVEFGEACDDGDADNCTPACNASCTGPYGPTCGDGIVNCGEACDDGNPGFCAGPCNETCTALYTPTCGNGILDCGEVCDDGDASPCGGPCDDTCTGFYPFPTCGNGVVECGEVCDDGDTSSCTGTCNSFCNGAANVCGDGLAICGEACDDGDADDCDACNSACQWVTGCGDGTVCGGEVCDDGDTSVCGGPCNETCTGPYPAPTCGDGVVQCGEACDDGDTDPCTAACDATCSGPGTLPVCGDGLVECGEACDDGDADSCTAGCDATCSGPAANLCGDGLVECGETCDDGNTTPGDGCDGACQRECLAVACPLGSQEQIVFSEDQFDAGVLPGAWQLISSGILNGGQAYRGSGSSQVYEGSFTIQAAAPTTFGVWVLGVRPAVGDWSFDVEINGAPVGVYDGSAAGATQLEWRLVGSVTLAAGVHTMRVHPVSTSIAYFDGVALTTDSGLNPPTDFLPAESFDLNDPALDSFNNVPLAECCGDCAVNGFEACDDGADNGAGNGFCLSDCSGIDSCGDGVLTGAEACDDGTANGSGDGFCLTDCSGVQTCGDGSVDGTETCDDGDADNCTLGCDATCSGPHTVVCGDAVAECGEACDDGVNDGGHLECLNCVGLQVCGDGVAEGAEICDDGDRNNCTTACDASCGGPYTVVCGDGLRECGEWCDDGDTSNCTNGCNATCTASGPAIVCGDGVAECGEFCDDGDSSPCAGPCDETCASLYPPFNCGDGVVECGETCDDGAANGTGPGLCDFGCQSVQACGDGTVQGTEVCDDGDTSPCGGPCNETCTANYSATCGNGAVECGETCDDGDNSVCGGPCDSACSSFYASSCGDGVVDVCETCDDGDTSPCSGPCNETCSAFYAATCGNGVVECGESCDDGNTVGYDGCSATCQGECQRITDWETGDEGWTHQIEGGTSPDLWHRSSTFAYSGSFGFYMGAEPAMNYDTGRVHLSLTSPPTPVFAGDELSFWEMYEFEGAPWDNAEIRVLDASGAYLGQLRNRSPLNDTLGAWNPATYSLNAYAGQQVRIQFYFDTIDTVANFFLGWFIDDVRIGQPGCNVVPPTICGDGQLQSGEVCDDGDISPCSGPCNETCTGFYASVCGNGVMECGETCDDGDSEACGACDETCTGPGIGPTVCGDGVVCGGGWGESCDDGDPSSCVGPCNETCTALYVSTCGDGVVQCGEACDDGNVSPCAGPCNETCTALYTPTCGNGVVECGEVCDDGDASPCGGPCDDACTGFYPFPTCGNGVVECGEVCDDGDTSACTGTCNSSCNGAANVCGDGLAICGEACDDGDSDDCDACNSACQWVTGCGDGTVCGGEVCDDGDSSVCGGPCNETCTGSYPAPTCGDGVVQCGEACDDGDADPCTADCDATCSGPGILPVCGDGVVECGEVCDDGDADSCTAGCDATCSGPAANLCGDGLVECGETCDDGNTTPGDGCDGACQRECSAVACPLGSQEQIVFSEDQFDAGTNPGAWQLISSGILNGGQAYRGSGSSQVYEGYFTIQAAAPTTFGVWVLGVRPAVGDWSFDVEVNGAPVGVYDGSAAGATQLEWRLVGSVTLAAGVHTMRVHPVSTSIAYFDGVALTTDSGLNPPTDFLPAASFDLNDPTLDSFNNVPLAECCGDCAVNGFEACDDGADNGAGSGFCLSDCSGIDNCGDGVLTGAEACDDGTANGSGDGFCLIDCSGVQTCGDGSVDGTETCDDGDADNCTLGCDATCSGPHTVVCGDAVAECGEACDDGVNDGGHLECLNCVGLQVCGDGVAEGTEICDDGDRNNCTTACDASCGGPYTVVCGDGLRECGEWCDDGDTSNCTNGCNATCTASGPAIVCGDGVAECGEVCDDGDSSPCAGPCNETCTANYSTTCGNGAVECGEACDDGAANGTGDGTCLSDCSRVQICGDGLQEGTEACDDGDLDNCTTACNASCSGPHSVVCGDGVVECGEACDDGDTTICGGTCNPTCTGLTAVCGDGVVECGEACDDGNTVDCDGCRSDCSATETGCGDGFICGAEICDDGNTIDCDGCRADCRRLDNLCGDGVFECGEACDDGDVDNCTTACDAICSGPYAVVCGDGVAECGETCDDNNATSCDGCSDTCVAETGCGDGVVCGLEVCDSEIAVLCNDGCYDGTTDCMAGCGAWTACDTGTQQCGNGAVEGCEACDDGNLINGDGCSDACLLDGVCDGTAAAPACDFPDDCAAQPHCSDGFDLCDRYACIGATGGDETVLFSDAASISVANGGWRLDADVIGTAENGGASAISPDSGAELELFWMTDLNSADYAVWIAAGEINAGSCVVNCDPDLDVSLDGAPLVNLPGGVGGLDLGANALGWFNLGVSTLSAGPHRIGLVCNNTEIGRLCGFDGLLVTTDLGLDPNSDVSMTPYATADWDDPALDLLVAGTQGRCSNAQTAAAGSICRLPSEDCDEAEFCDGAASTCPADALASDGAWCGDCPGAPAAPCEVCASGECPNATAVCGNATVETSEECDDGGTIPGDGCDDYCEYEAIAPFPFYDGFESGYLYRYWTVDGSANGSVTVSGIEFPDGNFHALMETGVDGDYALNELILTINLSGQSGVILSFDEKEFSEEQHNLPPSYSGSFNGDGVSISADGVTWRRVVPLGGDDRGYQEFVVDLDAAIAAAGIAYNGAFKIKFQQYDNYSIPQDGMAWDNIRVYSPICGNGDLEPGEVCEDGNTIGCDGCAPDCRREDNICGDGYSECSEACDDGDNDDCTVGCDAICSGPYVVVCGDGVTECGEVCDDGSADACAGTCNDTCDGPTNVCGDGVVRCGESCDGVGAGSTCPGLCNDTCGCDACVPLGCPGDERVASSEEGFDGGQFLNGWTPLTNALFNGGEGIYSTNSTKTFIGTFTVQSSQDVYYIWVLGLRPNANDPTDLSVRLDGQPIGAWDGAWLGGDYLLEWQEVTGGAGATLDAGAHTLAVNKAGGGTVSYFDGFVASTDPAFDPNADFTPTLSYDLDGAAADLFAPDPDCCGDCVVDAGETCDDGNLDACDGCAATCGRLDAVCGDGLVECGESCDDGNLTDGDGCSSACQPEGCGNGVVDPGEACDDGNRFDCDGCSSDCMLVETGCGDGVVCGVEVCDDGNTDACDGCAADCGRYDNACGDGFVECGESCDDGGLVDCDGCTSDCRLEFGCGDGVRCGLEYCDDGNIADCDGCSGDCRTIETGCGDGAICGLEICDDGNQVDCDGCSGDCLVFETGCGDGVVCGAESCDDGDASACGGPCNETCDANYNPVCGNGTLECGEACDDANTADCDGCSADCQTVESGCGDGIVCGAEVCDDGDLSVCGGPCNESCDGYYVATCGDGALDCGEICDDANTADCDGCRGDCSAVETGCGDGFVCGAELCDDGDLSACGGACNETCDAFYSPVCGDGVLDCGETCDDANTIDCDGCRGDCSAVETGCGDGFLCAPEVCDDANNLNGDGCRADCQGVENCGDGLVDVGEQCDDGGNADCDGCRADCSAIEFGCGDGFLCSPEVCDDGDNSVCGGLCNESCTAWYSWTCGNGVLECPEKCDDSNTSDCDGCRGDCMMIEFGCGDGSTCDAEACDDGNSIDCDGCWECEIELAGYCGDGVHKTCLEECDLGAAGNFACGSDCGPDCTIVESPLGQGFECGDGIVCGEEQCDDGNRDNGDECGFECNIPACGDGFTDPALGEECDNGGYFDPCGDLNPSAPCDGIQCLIPLDGCGDGYVCGGEECEPGGVGNCDEFCMYINPPGECHPTPIDVVLDIDVSGSMSNDRILSVQQALTNAGFIDEMCASDGAPEPPDDHTIAVVPFDTEVGDANGNIQPLTFCQPDFGQVVEDFVNSPDMTTGGNTYFNPALTESISLLDNSLPGDRKKIIIFLSAREAAISQNKAETLDLAYEAGQKGYVLYTIGMDISNSGGCNMTDQELEDFAAAYTPGFTGQLNYFNPCPIDFMKVMAHLAGGEFLWATDSTIAEIYSLIFTKINDCLSCGNGSIEVGEQCDDGRVCLAPAYQTDDCASCPAGWSCLQRSGLDYCADGFPCASDADCDAGLNETCETASGDSCNEVCELDRCGDGIVQYELGEICDDGNSNNNDACAMCKPAVCGDGRTFNDPEVCTGSECELCDDGGSCAMACQSGAGCLSGTCTSGLCECNGPAQCGAGYQCSQGVCIADGGGQPVACTVYDDPCSVGQTCIPMSNDGCSEGCIFEICATDVPTDIEFVVDKSGSMGGSQIQTLKSTLIALINHIWDERDPSIQVGLIAFNSSYVDHFNYTQLAKTEDPGVQAAIRNCVQSEINSINAGGGTRLSGPLQAARDKIQNVCGYVGCMFPEAVNNCQVNDSYDYSSCCYQNIPGFQPSKKIVIAMSDAQLGDTTASLAKVDQMRAEGISVYGIGIGASLSALETVFNGATCDSDICYQQVETSSIEQIFDMINAILDDQCVEVGQLTP